MQNKLIIKNILNFIAAFFRKGHPRTIRAKKNIFYSFILKAIMLIIGLIRLPLILNYLEPEKYGIWLTLGSVIGWIGLLDIGLGNGLRNKLSAAFANKDITLARTYVSTTYATLVIIIAFVYLIFLLINPNLNWVKILNTPSEMSTEISILAIIVVTSFSIQLVLTLINNVMLADQLPAYRDALSASVSLIYFIVILLLIKITSGSLIFIGLATGLSQIIVFAVASFYFYKKKYRHVRPSFKYINFKYFKNLAGLGFKFFIIQIATIVMFSTDNIIISQLYTPTEVAPYSIAYRYFFYAVMFFSIAISPLWSAITEAYSLKDFRWIKNIYKKIIYSWIVLVFIVLIMLLVSSTFYKLWIGDRIHIPFYLSLGMALFAIIRTWNSPFSSFANGVSKIKLQFYITILIGIINIPLSIIFAKYFNMGVVGVILATVVCLTIPAILMPIQYIKITNNTAKGIWNK
ncbi:lipopolysaccharide biosynthesis protein [Bacteroidota bacterium]